MQTTGMPQQQLLPLLIIPTPAAAQRAAEGVTGTVPVQVLLAEQAPFRAPRITRAKMRHADATSITHVQVLIAEQAPTLVQELAELFATEIAFVAQVKLSLAVLR